MTTTNGLIRDGALYLSATTMERALCWRRLWYSKVQGRVPAAPSAGLQAGSAVHAALAELNRGKSVAEQEAAISATMARAEMSPDDYRTPAYLHDALAQYRAEAPLAGWTIEEVEADGVLPLGEVRALGADCVWCGQKALGANVKVMWSFRRDAVGVASDGRRHVVDFKTSSRDEAASYQAMRNSGQFIGYLWSWNQQYPDRLAVGVQPVRIILRAPTIKGGGVLYSFPHDSPIYFAPERVEEWRRSVLRFAEELLRLDPEQPEQWRMVYIENGGCRTQWGCCPYLETCCLGTEAERAVHLASPAYRDDVRDDAAVPVLRLLPAILKI